MAGCLTKRLEGREKKRSWPSIMYYPSTFWMDRWKSRTLFMRIAGLRAKTRSRNIPNFAFACMWNLVSRPKEARQIVRLEAPMAVALKITVFWEVTPCILEYRFQRFGGTDCPNLQKFLSWRLKDYRCLRTRCWREYPGPIRMRR
jgi:hypothetical protein